MIDHTVALYCITDDLLKAVGHQDDARCEMTDSEVITAALVAAFNFGGDIERSRRFLRQYLPKGVSMAGLSQQQCNAIARKLNTRPRKRLGFRTPLECFNESSVSVALQT